jgi:hypothetical protein
VNVEVIAVKAFPGPDGGIFKRAGEGGQMAQFGKSLTQVEVAAEAVQSL